MWDGLIQEFVVTVIDNDNTAPEVDAGPDRTLPLVGGVPWTPQFSNLAAWYDAGDASTLTLEGSAVSEWRDKSGFERHATQSTAANQPAIVTDGLNGKSVLMFDGTTDFFAVDLNYLAGVAHSAFIVTKPTKFSNIYGAATASQGANSLHVGFNGTNYRMNYCGNSFGTPLTSNFIVGSVNIVNYVWVTGTGKQILANGALEGSDANAGNIGTMAGGGRIGHTTTASHEAFGGDIAEIVFFTGEVSLEERQNMEGYLAHKWGLAANLPAGHPYKSAAPGSASATATLAASASDVDGDPLVTTWSLVSGPGPVSFGDSSAVETSATFCHEGTYVLRLTAFDGMDTTYDEVILTVTDTVQETYSDWIAGFDLGERAGFNDDYNHDGVSNGMKYFFGIAPSEPSPGLSALAVDVSDGNKFTFTHPMGETVPAGIHAEYRWAIDLASFHADGASDGDGTTVTFVRGEPVEGRVTVTATLSGPPTDRIFVALVVTLIE